MKAFLTLVFTAFFFSSCVNQISEKEILPIPSRTPSEAQLKQIEKKYGMFIHYGMSTFNENGNKSTSIIPPASSYNPSNIDVDQWVETAKNAGMKYVVFTAKHGKGFCNWDSKYTEYDVANSRNTTNVVEAIAKACKKYNIDLGLYYALHDLNFNGINFDGKTWKMYEKNDCLDSIYNVYVVAQLDELIDITEKYTDVVEFWFDGQKWKKNYRWPLKEIYQTIKSRLPDCQITHNWTIGLPGNPDYHAVYPQQQEEGYPIRYFPSDYRTGDPLLPKDKDPKIFIHEGKEYYMPFESTVCISQKWFYHPTDTIFKTVDELVEIYKKATAQDNMLLLNCPPNREGKLREKDIEILLELKQRLEL